MKIAASDQPSARVNGIRTTLTANPASSAMRMARRRRAEPLVNTNHGRGRPEKDEPAIRGSAFPMNVGCSGALSLSRSAYRRLQAPGTDKASE